MKPRVIFLYIPLLFSLGCGYTLSNLNREQPSLPIYVPTFQNKTLEPGFSSEVSDAVINELILRGNPPLSHREEANFLLKGEIVNYQLSPLMLDEEENVLQYRISISARITLEDLREGKVLWSNKISEKAYYFTSGTLSMSEEEGRKNLVRKLAQEIVHRILDRW